MAETPKSPRPPAPTVLRVGGLSGRKPTRFRFAPDAAARAQMARSLDLLDLSALDMTGEIQPEGKGNFRLQARLTAKAEQACTITLAPVPATIGEDILRRYLADFEYPQAEEAEIPEDDSAEPMPETIDLAQIAAEALALALPLYPRAAGAALGQQVFGPPGTAPLSDDDLRPFAGLAGLAQSLKNPSQ